MTPTPALRSLVMSGSGELVELSRRPGEPVTAARKGERHANAVSALRTMIMTGELAPDQRLREVALCTQLGVSRTPVREAFRTLAAEGLVKLLPNRSVVVAEFDASEVGSLFEVFGVLEGLAGELACSRITDREIAEIAALQHRLAALHQRGERAKYLEVNHLIHRKIVEAAGNPVLESVWELLLPRMERARAMPNLQPERWAEALLEHAEILAALARRDGPLLAHLLREHFHNGAVAISRGALGAKPPTKDSEAPADAAHVV
jgi:DNA-binding GntR family transcriptional regulator